MWLIVDGMNVIGSRPDGWWRDRDAAARRLADRLRVLADAHDLEVVLVLDGREIPGLPAGRSGAIEVHYAARAGPDAGDDRIVELLADGGPWGDDAVTVVTADRALRRRASRRGAATMGPTELLRWLERTAGDAR